MGGGLRHWSRLSVCAGLEGGACLGPPANATYPSGQTVTRVMQALRALEPDVCIVYARLPVGAPAAVTSTTSGQSTNPEIAREALDRRSAKLYDVSAISVGQACDDPLREHVKSSALPKVEAVHLLWSSNSSGHPGKSNLAKASAMASTVGKPSGFVPGDGRVAFDNNPAERGPATDWRKSEERHWLVFAGPDTGAETTRRAMTIH